MFESVGLQHFLVVGLALFCLGLRRWESAEFYGNLPALTMRETSMDGEIQATMSSNSQNTVPVVSLQSVALGVGLRL